MRILTLPVVIVSLVLMANVQATTVYKGVDQSGGVVYSDQILEGVGRAKKVTVEDGTELDTFVPTKEYRHLEKQKATQQKSRLDNLVEQRKDINARVKEAYAELDAVEKFFQKAQEQQEQLLKQCVEDANAAPANGGNRVVICKPGTLAPLQAELAKTKAKLEKLLTRLDQLPR